jgi:hypothetical protein
MPIDARECLDEMNWLDTYYSSQEGLARPAGLSIGGKPDFEGVAAWILDVFVNSRLGGLTHAQSRQNVIHGIQQTSEWRQRHPSPAALLVARTSYVPNPALGRREFLQALHRLDVYYKSWRGLQRPIGLSLAGRPDFQAIAAWVFGSYLNSRLAGMSPEESWDRMVNAIEQAPEWRARVRNPVDATTLRGKHLMGYQGWFGTPNDGQNNGWDHWFRGQPTAANANFEFWPDTRECFDSELEATAMTMRNGDAARLYSSQNPRTLVRHFDWMADAGIDGVSLGRFVAGTTNVGTRNRLDNMLRNLRDAAEVTGRIFFVWYDITDSPAASFVADLKNDWRYLVQTIGITNSPSYLHHGGKPFVGIWGAGAEGRPGSPAEWVQVLTDFKNDPVLRSTVLVGCARNWRDSVTWAPVYAAADVVSPWATTGFRNDAEADAYRTHVLEPDLALTGQRGQDYMPILFPGFSWHNLQAGAHPMNAIPRRGGRFYWRQVFNAIDAGATNLFTTMYDEVDEGTAVYKVAETQNDVPAQGNYLTLDADGERLPSDWYLRLGGAAGRMLRGEIPTQAQIPIQP